MKTFLTWFALAPAVPDTFKPDVLTWRDSEPEAWNYRGPDRRIGRVTSSLTGSFSHPPGLRLLGIGRNQYIDLMNQCRSSKVRRSADTPVQTKTYILCVTVVAKSIHRHILEINEPSFLVSAISIRVTHCTCCPVCLPHPEILPQEVSTGPAPRQTSGNLSGAVVGRADGLYHGGWHKGERRALPHFCSVAAKGFQYFRLFIFFFFVVVVTFVYFFKNLSLPFFVDYTSK